MFKDKICQFIMFIGCLMLPLFVNAQVDPGEDPDAPIDGGIGLLIAAGAAYGYKRYKKSKSSDEVK